MLLISLSMQLLFAAAAAAAGAPSMRLRAARPVARGAGDARTALPAHAGGDGGP